MYKDMYKQYSPSDFQYAYPFSFNGKGVDYLNSLEQASYTWDYGDSVNIPFVIPCAYRSFPIAITVYNFRYEPLYKLVDYVDEEDGIFPLVIDTTESQEIFKKGLYYCGIQAFEYVDSYEETSEEPDTKWAVTLQAPNECLFRVV